MNKNKIETIRPGMTLYDLNKQYMKNQKPMTHLEIAAKQLKLEDWFNKTLDGYAMLLSNERHDYTVFHLYESQNENPCAIAASECIGCCTDRGQLISIDQNDDKNWEIWIRINGEDFMYMLFPCDSFVIEC